MSGSAPNRGDATDLPVTRLGTLPDRGVNAVKELSGNVRGLLGELHPGGPCSSHPGPALSVSLGSTRPERSRSWPDSAYAVAGLT
jgi:hypothetical protein